MTYMTYMTYLTTQLTQNNRLLTMLNFRVFNTIRNHYSK